MKYVAAQQRGARSERQTRKNWQAARPFDRAEAFAARPARHIDFADNSKIVAAIRGSIKLNRCCLKAVGLVEAVRAAKDPPILLY